MNVYINCMTLSTLAIHIYAWVGTDVLLKQQRCRANFQVQIYFFFLYMPMCDNTHALDLAIQNKYSFHFHLSRLL